jgi:hypothetical protein
MRLCYKVSIAETHVGGSFFSSLLFVVIFVVPVSAVA